MLPFSDCIENIDFGPSSDMAFLPSEDALFSTENAHHEWLAQSQIKIIQQTIDIYLGSPISTTSTSSDAVYEAQWKPR
jgi:hypothetical protein